MENKSKKVILLSKENLELAKEEVLSLVKSDFKMCDDLLIIDTSLNLEKRLGMSHSIYQFLFICDKTNLKKNIEKFNWRRVYEKDFCVRFHGDNLLEKELSIIIYNSLEKPKVNLKNPKTKIEFFQREKKIIACKHLSDVDKSFLKRKAHLRPELHPTSLNPGLAKACINLTGLTKGNILDPFCGSGGILIEAGIMGFNVSGYDLDEKQLERAKKNLSYYGIKNLKIEQKNALEISKKADAIVTDPPYGKSSKGKDILGIYEKFLHVAHKHTKNLVIIFPDFLDYESIINKSPWKLKKKFYSYVHKSLTKVIIPLFAH